MLSAASFSLQRPPTWGFPIPATLGFALGDIERECSPSAVGETHLGSAIRREDIMADDSDVRVAVIGAGPSGLVAGRELLKEGFRGFTIFEKADAVGGTWHQHSYRGSERSTDLHAPISFQEPAPLVLGNLRFSTWRILPTPFRRTNIRTPRMLSLGSTSRAPGGARRIVPW